MNKKLAPIALTLLLFILSALSALCIGARISSFIQRVSQNDEQWHDANTRFDSELGWAPIPNRSVYFLNKKASSNSLGFRSPELDRSKKHIVLIGSSVIWGFGVGDDQTASYYLQKDLDKENYKDYQVLNLGVSGYGIDQYYLWLKRNISAIDPKIIVVAFEPKTECLVTQNNYAWGRSKPLFIIDNDGKLKNINQKISKYSLVNLLDLLPYDNDHTLGSTCSWIRKLANMQSLDEPSLKKVIVLLLAKINELAVEHHAKLIFIISPDPRYYRERTSFVQPVLFFKDILNTQGYKYVDFSVTVKQNKWKIRQIFLGRHTAHYTPFGNEQLAETIKTIL